MPGLIRQSRSTNSAPACASSGLSILSLWTRIMELSQATAECLQQKRKGLMKYHVFWWITLPKHRRKPTLSRTTDSPRTPDGMRNSCVSKLKHCRVRTSIYPLPDLRQMKLLTSSRMEMGRKSRMMIMICLQLWRKQLLWKRAMCGR